MPPKATPLAVRFWRKVEQTDGCWLWRGGRGNGRYGLVRVGPFDDGLPRRQRLAHRVAYELEHGSIPDGAVICHTCDTPRCVNPAHLVAATQSANVKDAYRKGRAASPQSGMDRCRRGHEFNAENTYVTRSGSRQCRACCRINYAARQARLRSEAQ